MRINNLEIHSEAYVYSIPHHTITIPYHKTRVQVKNDKTGLVNVPLKYDPGNIRSIRMHTENSMVTQTRHEAIVAGSGLLTVMAKLENVMISIDDFRDLPIEVIMNLHCHEIETDLHAKVIMETPVTSEAHQIQWMFPFNRENQTPVSKGRRC